MTSSRIVTWATFLCVLLFSAVIYRLVPASTRDGVWTHNVLRNWEEYGFFKLGGKLVYNPGGHNAIISPRIYTGHHAASLYLPYLVASLSGDTKRAGLLFHILLAALTMGTTWHFLGRTQMALMVGCAAVLSPGFVRCNTFFDPLAVPVLLGLPVMCWSRDLLQRPSITWKSAFLLAIVMAGYSLLNWTVVFAFGIFAAYLFAAPETSRRSLFLFCSVAGVAAASIVAVSVLNKMQSGATIDTPSRWSQYYNAYLFGPGGYMGNPMDWPKAILRLVAASVIGLLPLLSVCAWLIWRRGLNFYWRSLSPFFAALLLIALMRNYFAQHPWMAASVLIFGMIFSISLLKADRNGRNDFRGPEVGTTHGFLAPAFAVASFLYCCAVVLLLRENSAGEDALRTLVQQNARRHDIIVVSRQTDALLAENAFRLSELFDRKIDVLDGLQPSTSDGIGESSFLLSASPPSNGRPELARTAHHDSFASDLARKILACYRRNIARRAKGDRLETEPVHYLFTFPKKQSSYDASRR
jgi:hypothetical protein